MAVNNVTTNAQMAYSAIASTGKKPAQAPVKKEEAVAEKNMGEAYAVNISAAGQQAAQKAEGAKADAVDAKGTEKAKGLTADQVRQLQDQTDQSYTMMIQAMTEQNMKVQNLFNEGIYSLNFDGTKVGIENFMLPPVAGGGAGCDFRGRRVFHRSGFRPHLWTCRSAVGRRFGQAVRDARSSGGRFPSGGDGLQGYHRQGRDAADYS